VEPRIFHGRPLTVVKNRPKLKLKFILKFIVRFTSSLPYLNVTSWRASATQLLSASVRVPSSNDCEDTTKLAANVPDRAELNVECLSLSELSN
jgi:hypothetical protein